MNDRIRQILLDAGGQYSSGNQNDWPSWVLGDAVVTKFAELIVRECADYANWYQANSRYTDIAKAIKEHFGVEE